MPGKSVEDIDIAWFEDAASEAVDNGAIRIADDFVLDIMFTACGQTYESLKLHAITVYIEDIPVKIVDFAG